MNPGAGDQFYPYGEFARQYPPGCIYPYMLNDRGNVNHSPSASVTNAESLPESSPQFIENGSTPSSSSTSSHPTSESKKAQDRWSKEEEKLLVQLWAEKHDQLESRESRKTQRQRMNCRSVEKTDTSETRTSDPVKAQTHCHACARALNRLELKMANEV